MPDKERAMEIGGGWAKIKKRQNREGGGGGIERGGGD
jgi:hypothetical protein